jgi:hypothetical protein
MSYIPSSNNPGFFTYSNPIQNMYFSFKPTELAVSNNKLYIKHIGPTKDSIIYVVFNLEKNDKANPLVENETINLNSLISDELERTDSRFKLTSVVAYNYSGTESNFSSGIHVFEVAGKIRIKNTVSFGTFTPLSGLKSSTQTIKLTPGSFATDDIVCDTGEVSKAASQEYSTQVAGTIGLNVGIGMFVVLALVGISIYFRSDFSFKPDAALLGGWESTTQKAYGFFIGVFLIISFSCFIAYGVRMGKGGNKTDIVTGELTSAILFLVLPVVMLWLKAKVLISDPTSGSTI